MPAAHVRLTRKERGFRLRPGRQFSGFREVGDGLYVNEQGDTFSLKEVKEISKRRRMAWRNLHKRQKRAARTNGSSGTAGALAECATHAATAGNHEKTRTAAQGGLSLLAYAAQASATTGNLLTEAEAAART